MQRDSAKGSAIDDLPGKWDGFVRLVRPGLGLQAFGSNIMNLPPDYTTESHSESKSGQEELYVGITGSGAVVLGDGTRLPLDCDHLAAVGADIERTLVSEGDGLRVLIVGAAPGAYESPGWSDEGDD